MGEEADADWEAGMIELGRESTTNWLDEMQRSQARTFQSLKEGKCGCHLCIKGRGEVPYHMVTCKTCGNKRCPHATDHKLACTGSNEPGQACSVYQ